MFTGIVQGIGKVSAVFSYNDFKSMTIWFPSDLLDGISISCSVAINGVCLSVTKIEGNYISFDVINETLKITNLKAVAVDQFVNLERSAKMNTEVGGHFLSGHIIDVANVRAIQALEKNYRMEIQMTNKSLMKYVFYKGYVAIDGISLTIGKVFEDYFYVHLIPETMEKTTMSKKAVGDALNIEVDSQTQVIVNTVERVLKENYGNLRCLCHCTIETTEDGSEEEQSQ
ncbi:hypothetical protein M8J76_008337 [Diaphorina citri]|nr:hypothetical protein M8J76_008337 [Diaphorina citri]KAI5720121.1 hypothetical protein M8J77_002167 [Diaphorina citri]